MTMQHTYTIQFHFTESQGLWLLLTVTYDDKPMDLSHSAFLLHLYRNESDLSQDELDFAYRLAKHLKKIRLNQQLHYAITSDDSMAWFFLAVHQHGVSLMFDSGEGGRIPITYNKKLPLTCEIDAHSTGLSCHLHQYNDWINDPLAWLTLYADGHEIIFSNGLVLIDPPSDFSSFMAHFLEKNPLVISKSDTLPFIQRSYKPHQNMMDWKLNISIDNYLPDDSPPIPHLILHYQEALQLTLNFAYGKTLIESHDPRDIIDSQPGEPSRQRSPEMESLFQQELMDIFTTNDLPFLLKNPGDIACFYDKVIPTLESRGWTIDSRVTDFSVEKDPVTLDFSIESSGQDWFQFDGSCTINGDKIPFPEIARMMVDNQGYVKVGSSFIKVDETSQKTIETLSTQGAFDSGKQFKHWDILPLLSTSTQIKGKDPITTTFIEDFQGLQKLVDVDPGPEFKGELRDYQQFGVNWIHFLYQNRFGGILADDMGLGKTVQTIAFVNQLKDPGPVLVIGPTNVLYNWEQEVQKFAPNRTAFVYAGANRQRSFNDLIDYDFVIMSFGVLKQDIDQICHVPFKAIFVDEAQNIKNANTQLSKAMKRLESRFKLVMTGTPIENHIQDLWNLFDFVMPQFLGASKGFQELLKNGSTDALKQKIKPFVLRREKQEVLTSLPEKTEIILTCPMKESQEKLYQTVLSAAKQGIRSASGQKNKLNMLTALLKLRQVCTHPGLLSEFKGQDLESTKFEMVQDKLTALIEEGHKVVLFSQFTSMLTIIEDWLSSKNIYIERIDGTVNAKARIDAVNRFQTSDDPCVFLISLKAGGVGLNLTAADYVIHMDPWWNPAIESQATDRVHRMGQQNKVIVYKLITEGTIEERIQDLQASKRELLSELIDIDSATDKSLALKDIEALLLTS